MKEINYEFMYKYTKQVIEATGYESATTGETINLTPTKKLVYLYFVDSMFSGVEFSISQDGLAEMLGLDRRTVMRTLSEFLEHGVLEGEKKKQMGGFKQYIYTSLTLPLTFTYEKEEKTKPITRKRISARTRFTVMHNSNFCCHYCGKLSSRETSLVVDHVIPVAKGGTDDIENLVASCEECNQGKSDMLI